MINPPHRHPHHRHSRTHTCRHHRFPVQTYYTLSSIHSALIHHRLPMFLPSHPHPHCRDPHPHTHRHHWFPGDTSSVQSQAVVTTWRWGWHCALCFHHLRVRNPHCPWASQTEIHHPSNGCLLGCFGQCFRSQTRQAPIRRSNN